MNSQEHIAFINQEIARLEEERKIFSLAGFFEDIQKLLHLSHEDNIFLTGCIDKQQGLFVIVDHSNPEMQYPLVRKFWDLGIIGEHYNHDEIQDMLKTNNLVITKTMTPAEFINRYAQDKYAKIYLNETLNENLTDKLPFKALKI